MKYSWHVENNSFLMVLSFAQNTYVGAKTDPKTMKNLLNLKSKIEFILVWDPSHFLPSDDNLNNGGRITPFMR